MLLSYPKNNMLSINVVFSSHNCQGKLVQCIQRHNWKSVARFPLGYLGSYNLYKIEDGIELTSLGLQEEFGEEAFALEASFNDAISPIAKDLSSLFSNFVIEEGEI